MDGRAGEVVLVVSDAAEIPAGSLTSTGILMTTADAPDVLPIGVRSLAGGLAAVDETLFLGRELRRFGFVRTAEQRREAGRLLTMLGVDAAPSSPMVDLGEEDRLLVAVGQALVRRPAVVVIEQRGLSVGADHRFADAIGLLRDAGTRVFVLGGRVTAWAETADRVVAVRAGAVAGELTTRRGDGTPVRHDELLDGIVGLLAPGDPWASHNTAETDRAARFADRAHIPAPGATPHADRRELGVRSIWDTEGRPAVLAVNDWTVEPPSGHRPVARGVTLQVHAGEMVALIGDGSAELIASLFARGFGERISGSVTVDGVRTDHLTPERSVRAGIAYASEQPLVFEVSTIGGLSTRVSSETLATLTRIGLVDRRRQHIAGRASARSRSRAAEASAGYTTALEAWATALENGGDTVPTTGMPVPRVVLLDDPFASERDRRLGVVRRLARAGTAMLLGVTSVDDALAIADRVLVCADGVIREPARPGAGGILRELLS